MRSLRDVLLQDVESLRRALSLEMNEARIEVQCLLQYVLSEPRAHLLAHPERVLNVDEQTAYAALLQRRLRGEPIAHLLREREFFGLSFKVTSATLIPRPETELLVELALQRIPPRQSASREVGRFRVLDLGTGTGAIALSIAHTRSDVEVLAVDASEAALQVARENAVRLATLNVSFMQSDWFSALSEQHFDLIVSNPPYIAAGDIHLAQGDVRFEPLTALVAGADGLDDIRTIVAQAGAHLKKQGSLLLEHGYNHATAVRDLLIKNRYVGVFSAKDIGGIERVSGGAVER